MRLVVTPTFKRASKRLHANQKADLDDAVRAIGADPLIGEPKVGDLAGVRGFKFRMAGQQCLLAYSQPDEETVKLLALGADENFYRDLIRTFR